MILVTVGSTMFPFQRMSTLVEHIAHIRPRQETIVYQYGHTPPHFLDPHITLYPFLPYNTFLAYMKKARIIISHGGPATIYQALSFGKRPWVLPREAEFGEHINDHQLDFSLFLASHNLIRLITPQTPIADIAKSDTSILPVRKNNRVLFRYLDELVVS